jgi:hypothetical protein
VPLIAFLSCLAAAQETREQSSYTYDVNGNRVPATSVRQVTSNGRTTQTERLQTVNGRSVPVETIEENVISDSGGSKVTERLIRHFDQAGNPLSTDKVRIELRQTSTGSTSTATVYRSDLNGRFEIAERSTTELTKSGDVLKSSTIIERPEGGGSLRAVEKQDAIETARPGGSAKDVVTWRKDPSGRYYEAARETTDVVRQGNRSTSTVTQYNSASSGKLDFVGQTVSELERNSDGSERRVVNVYRPMPNGRTVSAAEQQAFLQEQQIFDRRKRSDGSTVEAFGVRRADVTDGRLGEYQRVSEAVCKGNCNTTSESAVAEVHQPAEAKNR